MHIDVGPIWPDRRYFKKIRKHLWRERENFAIFGPILGKIAQFGPSGL